MAALQIGLPLVAGGISIVPIERLSCRQVNGTMGCWFSWLKEPFAIIICEGRGVRAIDMQSTEISMDSLRDALPDLDALLVSLFGGVVHQGENY